MERMARDLLIRAGRNRAFTRRLPRELGGLRFLASTEGGLKYLRPRVRMIDPELLGFAKRFIRQGMTVWDVGANLGLFTFASAGLVGRNGQVVAIEPDPWLIGNLQRSIELNPGLDSVCLIPAAVSDQTGFCSLIVDRRSRACNALEGHGNATQVGIRTTQLVPTTSLDRLLSVAPTPDVIKIDVEHAEVLALQGAETILREIRPAIHIEVAPDNKTAVAMILAGARYRIADPGTEAPLALPEFNTLALPL